MKLKKKCRIKAYAREGKKREIERKKIKEKSKKRNCKKKIIMRSGNGKLEDKKKKNARK